MPSLLLEFTRLQLEDASGNLLVETGDAVLSEGSALLVTDRLLLEDGSLLLMDGFADVADTESTSLAEGSTLAVGDAAPYGATLADLSALAVSGTEVGTLGDTASPALAVAETGTASETSAIAASLTASDAGAVSESAGLQLDGVDLGTLGEQVSGSATGNSLDAGAMDEGAGIGLVDLEVGTASEFPAFAMADTDAPTLDEVSDLDTGGSLAVSDADMLALADAEAIDALLDGTDLGSVGESGVLDDGSTPSTTVIPGFATYGGPWRKPRRKPKTKEELEAERRRRAMEAVLVGMFADD